MSLIEYFNNFSMFDGDDDLNKTEDEIINMINSIIDDFLTPKIMPEVLAIALSMNMYNANLDSLITEYIYLDDFKLLELRKVIKIYKQKLKKEDKEFKNSKVYKKAKILFNLLKQSDKVFGEYDYDKDYIIKNLFEEI